MSDTQTKPLHPIANDIQEVLGVYLSHLPEALDLTYRLKAEDLSVVVAVLKSEAVGVDFFVDHTAVEYDDRMELVYHFARLADQGYVTLKVALAKEDLTVASLCDQFAAADLLERESYDLMGITYTGHPNLSRLLCPNDFEGHPLRKDYVVNMRLSR